MAPYSKAAVNVRADQIRCSSARRPCLHPNSADCSLTVRSRHVARSIRCACRVKTVETNTWLGGRNDTELDPIEKGGRERRNANQIQWASARQQGAAARREGGENDDRMNGELR